MAGQRVEMDVDPNFEIHTSYHSDFFLLRTRVLVNGDNTEIRSLKEGKYEGAVLNFRHSGSSLAWPDPTGRGWPRETILVVPSAQSFG